MKRFVGYLIFGLGLLIFWPVQIGLALYGLYYIIMAFIDAGVIAGLISIPIVVACLTVTYIVIHLLVIPYMVVVNSLLGKRKERLREIDAQYFVEKRNAEFEKDIAHIQSQLKKTYMERGMAEQAADNKARQDLEKIHAK